MSREEIGLTGQFAPVFTREDVQAGDWVETHHALPLQGVEVLVMTEAANSPVIARRVDSVWRTSAGQFVAGVLLGDLWSFIPEPTRVRTLERVRVLEQVAS